MVVCNLCEVECPYFQGCLIVVGYGGVGGFSLMLCYACFKGFLISSVVGN